MEESHIGEWIARRGLGFLLAVHGLLSKISSLDLEATEVPQWPNAAVQFVKAAFLRATLASTQGRKSIPRGLNVDEFPINS